MNNVSYHIAFAKTLAFIFTQYAIFKISYEELDRYIREGIEPEEKIKNKIDEMHKKNLFKLELMPCFEIRGEGDV